MGSINVGLAAIIVNPVSGLKKINTDVLESVLHPVGIEWSIEYTRGKNDAYQLAKKFVDQSARVVAVYGGDGTVAEAASGLVNTETALAILPGGTGNVMAHEFDLPIDFVHATRLLTSNYQTKKVDAGKAGDHYFLIRAGVGLESLVVEKAPRELKKQFGLLAYGIAAINALTEARQQNYRLNLDGETVEVQGVLCTVANSGHLGLPGLSLAPTVNLQDGFLDVIVVRKIDVSVLTSLLLKTVSGRTGLEKMQHWQVRSVEIDIQPPQAVQLDGDILESTPCAIRCMPGSLRVVTQ